jgi:hypothetical protein
LPRPPCRRRAAALGHVGSAPPALAAERLDPGADQVDRAEAARQVVGDRDGERHAALVDGCDRRHARTQPLLGLVEQAAKLAGLKAFNHLAGELDTGDVLVRRTCRRSPSAQRQRPLGLRKLALEPAPFVDQGRNPRLHLLGAGAKRGSDSLQRLLAADEPAQRTLTRHRLDPPHPARHRALADDAEQRDVTGGGDMRAAAQLH